MEMEPITSNNNTAMDVEEAEATPSLKAKTAVDDEATAASSPTTNDKEDDYESDSDNDTQMEEPEPPVNLNEGSCNNGATKTEQQPEPEKPLSSNTVKAATTTTKPTSTHSEPSIYPIQLPLDFVPAPEDVVLGQQEQEDESRNDDDDTNKPNNRTAQFLELVRNSMREYSQTTDKQARMLLLKVAKTRASKEYGRFVRVVEGNRYVEIGVAQAMRECVKAHHRHQQQHQQVQAGPSGSRHYPHQRSDSSLGGSLSGLDNAREPFEAPDKKRCKNAPQFARSSSSSSKTIQQALPKDYKPRQIDVIFGRGGGVNQHPGNQFYRRVLQQQQPHYMKSQKLDKVRVARHVLEQVQNRGGMFVQNVPCWGGWCQVKDSVALSKIAQGFRDCKKQDDTHSASSSGTSASAGATSAASAVIVGVVPPPLDTTAAATHPQKPQPVVWGNPSPPSSHRSSPPPSMVVSPQLSPRPPFEQLAAASAAPQDPSAEASPPTSVLASLYPTRAQLDHDIRQLQSVLAQAQHSQDLALLQAAVHAEERLPLLQALQQQHPPLASLQQERDGLRQRLSSNTGLAPKKRLALAKRVADLTQQCQREEQALWQYRIVAAAASVATPTTTIAAASAPTAPAAAPQPLVVTPNRRRAQQPLMMSSFRSAAATNHRLSKEELEEDDNNNSSTNNDDVVIISSDDSERGTLLLPVTSPTITQQRQTIQEARDEGYRQRNDNDDDEDDDASSSSGSSSASSVSLICAV